MSYCSPFRLAKAARMIHAGAVVAHPTEAVWGLTCSPWNAAAVARLLQVKRRAPEKGLILIGRHTGDFEALLAQLSESQRAAVEQSWPGPNTWIVPDPGGLIPSWVRGEHQTQALRVSNHPLTSALCEAVGGPIISTSANLSGRPSPFSAWQVRAQLGNTVDYYLHGSTGGGRKASSIRDAISGEILRP